MIKFKDDLVINSTGIVYDTMLKTAKDIYAFNPELAGEYALSALEMVLSGDCSTDNEMLRAMFNVIKPFADRNIAKLEAKKEQQNNAKIEKMKLKEIAELYENGFNYQEIAKSIGITRQTVSNRIKIIQAEFPELLNAESGGPQELQGEYLGGTIKISDLNRSTMEYDVVDNFAYFPSTGVRLKIVPDD